MHDRAYLQGRSRIILHCFASVIARAGERFFDISQFQFHHACRGEIDVTLDPVVRAGR